MDQLQKYLNPPPFEDEELQRVADIEYRLLLVMFVAAVPVLLIAFIRGNLVSFSIALASVLSIVGCLWFVQKKLVIFVAYFIPFALVIAATLVLIFENKRVHDFTILLYPIAIILSGLMIGRKAPLTFSFLIIGCLVIMYIAEINGWISPAEFNPTYFSDLIFITIFILMTGFLVYVATNIINKNLYQLQDLNIRLQQSETTYRLLFEESPDAILITDENGIIRMANSSNTTMLGYSQKEIIGKYPHDFVAPEDLERRAPTKLSLLKKGHTFRHDRVLIRKDGSRVYAQTSSKALPDGRFQFLATDISERVKAEKMVRDLNLELEQRVQERTNELAASYEKLEVELRERQKFEKSLSNTLARTMALYHIAHAIIAQDDLPKLLKTIVNEMVKALAADDGLLITFDLKNQTVLQFVRYETGLEDIKKVSYEELWHGLSGWVMRELKPALSLKGQLDPRESEKARQIRAADQRGSIIVVPLYYRKRIFGTLTALNRLDQPDFTDNDVEMMTAIANQASIAIQNARLFGQLRQHAQDLELTNKELESFAYSVSHDLRAPLRVIYGFSQILIEDHSSQFDEEGQQHLQRVLKAAKGMDDLIDTLLTFSRLTRVEINRVEVDLSTITQNILSELQNNHPERNVAVTVEPDIFALADYNLMLTVLTNLLENAWKYTSSKENGKIYFGSYQNENQQVYYVQDNGVGFDMEYADKLFAPFQRLHTAAEFPGHGVGLASVQRIIHRHGGRIWAESQPGKGATFCFTL